MRCFDGFSERAEVRRVIDVAMDSDAVQGVVFELDPGWLAAWRIEESFGPRRFEILLEPWWPRRMPVRYWSLRDRLEQLGLSPHWIPSKIPTASDVEKWQPPYWKEYQNETWRNVFDSPVIIKICLIPPLPERERGIPRFENENLNIVYETRPRAQLFAGSTKAHNPLVGGISIGVGPDDYGTLGGLLRDNQGKRYGLTCAHVATTGEDVFHPAKADGSTHAKRIGKVALHGGLKICPAKSPCSWRATGSYVNDVDVALIEIDPALSSKHEVFKIGAVTGIRSGDKLVQGMAVELTGRSAGHKSTLELGGNGKYYKIPDGRGGEYCVRNTIELTEPSYYRNITSSPVDEGDSGAWVCAPAAAGEYDWCAMVIGGTGFTGIALESETISDWWRRTPPGLNLSVS
jgi:hypothetical protein